MSLAIRPFTKSDRDQVAALVNAHVGAVVPGISVPVNTRLSQLEREPGEFIVDPCVRERVTLVAVQRSRVVAAAHLLRYVGDDRASGDYPDAAEIRWSSTPSTDVCPVARRPSGDLRRCRRRRCFESPSSSALHLIHPDAARDEQR